MKRIIIGILVFAAAFAIWTFAGSYLHLTGVSPVMAKGPSEANTITTQSRISSGTDDAEERPNGSVSLNSTDLELITDSDVQTVGMVFRGLEIPKDVVIVNAYIQFQVDEVSITPTQLLIRGEGADNAETFTTTTNNITSRPMTDASATWSPPAWTEVAAAGIDQRTPDLSAIIQEVIDRPGWASGNPIALIISGTGTRVAEAYDGRATGAPVLHVAYQNNTPSTKIIQSRVSMDIDDAEERPNGSVSLDSLDLEFVIDGKLQTVGMVFRALEVPQNAVIVNAHIQFQVDEPSAFPTNLIVHGEATDNAETFTTAANDITARPLTDAAATWSPPAWIAIGAAGPDQRTPDLSAIIQEIIDQPGWAAGNAIALIISGTGTRIAESFEGGAPKAPVLYIEYKTSLSAPDTTTIQSGISIGTDDAEERPDGSISLESRDLEFAVDGKNQTVGMVFRGLGIPQGAVIENAYIQFQTDEATSDQTDLIIRGEATDDAAAFTATPNDITSRPMTTASVGWTPPAWTEIGASGADQRTPDLSSIIQEIINRPGWASGNAIALIISGTGTRTAEAFEGDSAGAPMLHIEFKSDAEISDNPAPPTKVETPEEQKFITEHTVQKGETLSSIALKYYGSVVKEKYMVIYEANKDVIGDNPNKIKTGQVLIIPEL